MNSHLPAWLSKWSAGPTAIVLRSGGFEIRERDRKVVSLDWSEVQAIRAYQRDLVMQELTCLDIEQVELTKFWTVTEDADGFWAFNDACKKELPGFDAAWELYVHATPNSENSRIVYVRLPNR
jgi:hypothetical protein